jgi:RimJ/RimL family protein N-acetyltransferase
MPFCHPWTDAPPAELGANTLRHYWEIRSRLGPDDWTINFLARLDGRVIGTQGLTGRDFARIRQVSTGSWIGSRHQGRGLGTEMRAAVLMFAFDQLGATVARSSAFADNPRSLGVSRRLGYVDDGTTTDLRRGVPATQVRLRLAAQGFRRPSWPLDVTGLAAVRSTLGVAAGVDRPGCGVR